jgi:hypothetical protein
MVAHQNLCGCIDVDIPDEQGIGTVRYSQLHLGDVGTSSSLAHQAYQDADNQRTAEERLRRLQDMMVRMTPTIK